MLPDGCLPQLATETQRKWILIHCIQWCIRRKLIVVFKKKCSIYLKRKSIGIPSTAQTHGFPFLASITAADICWSPPTMCIFLNWKQPKLPLTGEWVNKPGCTHVLGYYSAIIGINSWYIQQFGWISEALCWTKEASPKRLNIIWCQLLGLLRKTKLGWWRTGQWLPGVGVGMEVMIKTSLMKLNWSVFPL